MTKLNVSGSLLSQRQRSFSAPTVTVGGVSVSASSVARNPGVYFDKISSALTYWNFIVTLGINNTPWDNYIGVTFQSEADAKIDDLVASNALQLTSQDNRRFSYKQLHYLLLYYLKQISKYISTINWVWSNITPTSAKAAIFICGNCVLSAVLCHLTFYELCFRLSSRAGWTTATRS